MLRYEQKLVHAIMELRKRVHRTGLFRILLKDAFSAPKQRGFKEPAV